MSSRLRFVLSHLSLISNKNESSAVFCFILILSLSFILFPGGRRMWRPTPCWRVAEAAVHPADVDLLRITGDPPVICPSCSYRRHLWSDKWDTFSYMIFRIWHTVLNQILWCLRGQNKDARWVPHLITDCGISFSLHWEFNWKRLCDMLIKQDKPTHTNTHTHREREREAPFFPPHLKSDN